MLLLRNCARHNFYRSVTPWSDRPWHSLDRRVSWFTGEQPIAAVGKGQISGTPADSEYLLLTYPSGATGHLLYNNATFSAVLPNERMFTGAQAGPQMAALCNAAIGRTIRGRLWSGAPQAAFGSFTMLMRFSRIMERGRSPFPFTDARRLAISPPNLRFACGPFLKINHPMCPERSV